MRRLLLILVAVSGCDRDPLGPGELDAGVPDLAHAIHLPDAMTTNDSAICIPMELQFQPAAPNLQIVVWIEDANGNFIDTLYLTSATAKYGLGNRPGAALLKTGDGWPYGRREMVAPVWAHRRNHRYPLVTMGGICGNSPNGTCADGTSCSGNCDDNSIAYHSLIASLEPHYKDPIGMVPNWYSVKGAYADPTSHSLYPPRGDLTKVDPNHDSADVADFVQQDDLAVISQATPLPGAAMAIPWNPTNPVDGDFAVFIEASAEGDFNQLHNHPNQPDDQQAWDFEGVPFLGQPSIVYRIAFHAGQPATATAMDYAGYGSWDGSTGLLNPPDATITTDKAGSGAGRLQVLTDSDGSSYRMKVTTSSCK